MEVALELLRLAQALHVAAVVRRVAPLVVKGIRVDFLLQLDGAVVAAPDVGDVFDILIGLVLVWDTHCEAGAGTVRGNGRGTARLGEEGGEMDMEDRKATTLEAGGERHWTNCSTSAGRACPYRPD